MPLDLVLFLILLLTVSIVQREVCFEQLMHGLKLAEIEVNRKMLADLAVNDAAAFTALADAAKAKLGK